MKGSSTSDSFLFADALEWCPILLAVHKPSGRPIPFGPGFRLGVVGLRTIANGTEPATVTFGRVCRHRSLLLSLCGSPASSSSNRWTADSIPSLCEQPERRSRNHREKYNSLDAAYRNNHCDELHGHHSPARSYLRSNLPSSFPFLSICTLDGCPP